MNKDVFFPYYSGNIKLKKVIGIVSLESFINAHKNPKPRTERLLKLVGCADTLNYSGLKRRTKQKLFSFTPSAMIDIGNGRSYKNIKSFTGLMQMDFDGIEDIEKAKDIKEYIFNHWQQVVCSYLSPSGRGVKCLLNIRKPNDIEHYRAIHKAVTNEFECIGYYDESTKNAVLPLFLSIDKDILYRDISECTKFIEEDWSKVSYVNLVKEPTRHHPTSNDYYYNKTVSIFEKKIDSIVDYGHPQLRSACLILGSRASAGYIDVNEAIQLAENAIDNNSYLQKDVNNYKSTARWSIENGFKNPRYYNEYL